MYKLNYFNFKKFDDAVLMTNDFGKYMFVKPSELKKIISKQLDMESELADKLIKNQMIYNESNLEYSARNKYLMRSIKHRLTRAHREKQLKMSCQALHNAPPNRT